MEVPAAPIFISYLLSEKAAIITSVSSQSERFSIAKELLLKAFKIKALLLMLLEAGNKIEADVNFSGGRIVYFISDVICVSHKITELN